LRYNPPTENENVETEDQEVYFEGRPRYISDQTAFMRWSTELEKTDTVIDKKFMEDNKHRIIDVNKILPLSFIDNPKSIKLFRLRRMNMSLACDAGLMDLADETVMDNLADYQTTRGIRGNYQNALITQRREWKDRTDPEAKKGLLGKMIKGRNDEIRQANMEEIY